MKTIYRIAFVLSLAVALMGCNEYYNEQNFEDYDNVTITDVKAESITLTDKDYKAIADNATNKTLAGDNADLLKAVATNKYFTEATPASVYMPAYLGVLYHTADNESAVKVTYNYLTNSDPQLAILAAAETYEVSDADYTAVWGEVEANYFTPSKPLSKSAHKFLSASYPEAKAGDVKIVSYKYSANEPQVSVAEPLPVSINEDFSTITANEAVQVDGWQNIAEKGTFTWTGKAFSGNSYAQCSAYKSTEDVVAWLVSPKVNLASAKSPKLAFDTCLGNYAGDCWSVLVSSDYNGKDLATATWIDVTHYFGFSIPSGKYGIMSPAGVYDLNNILGDDVKELYVAFRYTGDTKVTTTWQIDNVQIGDVVDVAETEVYYEPFATAAEFGDFTNVTVNGTKPWVSKTFNNNNYIQCSANKSTGAEEHWLLSKGIAIPAMESSNSSNVPALSFDVCIGYWNANCLSVLVSTDYTDNVATATWTDISKEFMFPQEPTSAYGKLGAAGTAALNTWAGKTIYIAFKYVGNGVEAEGAPKATTTYQIDNVKIATLSHKAESSSVLKRAAAVTSNCLALYVFDGTKWAESTDAAIVNPADYSAMGQSYGNFSGTSNDKYLPLFMAEKFPYGVEGDTKYVVYLYKKGDTTTYKADLYKFTTAWEKETFVTEQTDQFVKSNGKWLFNPSVVINLLPVKGNALSMAYYQAVVDWVATNKGEQFYQGTYTNAEYYYGASAYYCNIDIRPGTWKTAARDNAATGYADMSEEDVKALALKRLPEAFIPALEKFNSDLAPIAGTEVTATIRFALYDGTTVSEPNKQIVYKVVSTGKFEYVSMSDL